VKEPIVVDSTCLISLERIGCLDILPALFEPILIPPEVQREFGTSLPWLTVETPADQSLVAALKMLIDDGEAEAIALAQERGADLILIDEERGCRRAEALGFNVLRTLGVLLQAKARGRIATVKQ
jgi:predicted nucleic acid-binding protein